ncbi:ATP-binding protein [Dysgonomonas macrotermitis]|uniref:Predicted ATP-dependent endonuclease of the OLD family, contains P-loop ATPase and TOPRIM domains n=1 Tax=Dysgonomonas macrotermitis TaxID=1346286 RepID=A0A1M5G100_9BACT|nr:ATP-binding protein [Dysgonomonas macrotermitis]SHF97470.1 Predicted ATP-dependent endonuclease of the OLD family, contains P-loop ATPase and TOPRIM domains [Dysgonomonas macrotermitis]
MIVNIINNGRILKDSFNILLPDLTILTGENGSGKTQLLMSIIENSHGYWELQNTTTSNIPNTNPQLIYPVLSNDGRELKDIIYSFPGLKTAEIEHHQYQKPLIQDIKEQWNILNPISKSYILIKDQTFDNDINKELMILNQSIVNFAKSLTTDNTRLSDSQVKKVSEHQLKQLKKISIQSNKSIENLTFIDFIIFYDLPTNIFSSALDLLFHQFHLKQKYYKELTINTPPPWVVFYNILEKANFKYRAEYIPSENEEFPSPVNLIDKENGMSNVYFETLSSGEKTIMALIFVLYHSSSNGKFPEVILFDEPDAHLHPSLTQLFLSVIEKVLVEEQKVKVMLTTHSPSTIALAPDDSIYRMDRTLGYPVKENKNTAIQSLSNGLASVTIEYGNLGISYNLQNTTKHIVFTEGITDKIILEIAWKKLYNNKEMPFFIQDSFSASFLGNMFNQGDQDPDGIFIQFPEKIKIALFDFDQAGYSNWNREKKFPSLEETDPTRCLVRSNKKNGYLLLLPVPDDDEIKKLVIKNKNETFEDKSNLTIESLFLNVPLFKETYFIKESVLGGGSIYLFKGDKRKFAKNLTNLAPSYFKEFHPLFAKIEYIINQKTD